VVSKARRWTRPNSGWPGPFITMCAGPRPRAGSVRHAPRLVFRTRASVSSPAEKWNCFRGAPAGSLAGPPTTTNAPLKAALGDRQMTATTRAPWRAREARDDGVGRRLCSCGGYEADGVVGCVLDQGVLEYHDISRAGKMHNPDANSRSTLSFNASVVMSPAAAASSRRTCDR